MAQKRNRKRNKRLARQRRRRMKVLLGLIFVCLVLMLGISYALLHHYVSKFPDDKIAENIYIGNIEASGMTRSEAKAKLDDQMASDKALNVSVMVEGQSADATLEEYGLGRSDTDELVDKAMNYGKKGSLWSRFRKLRKLSKDKLVIAEGFKLDQEEGTTLLTERAVPLAVHAQDAVITKSESGFEISAEQEGKTVDIKATLSALEKYLNDDWNHETFLTDAVMKKEMPSVTTKDLESIQDELGSFSTDAGGGERWQNLKTGVEKLNGTVLMPGEEVSVHDVTAPYDVEHGYVAAGSYENGQVVDTYGGGICQVSSTLYNAVLYSELEVVKRYPHSMLVSYVKPSMDAAIAGDVKDFVFKNNYDSPIYIFGEIDGANQLRFTIYGKDTREEGRSIEYEVETISSEEPGTTYKTDSEARLGSMNTTGSAYTGKVVQLWKVVYQDGNEVSRDVINNSTYNKSDRIIKVGTKSDNAQAAALVANAVATQDKEKIDEAIAQAKALVSQ